MQLIAEFVQLTSTLAVFKHKLAAANTGKGVTHLFVMTFSQIGQAESSDSTML